jgi:hypothetical protein
MKPAAADEPGISQAEQRNVEGALQGMFRDPGYRRRRGCWQRPLHEPDRFAGEGSKASRKARSFEPPYSCRQGFIVRGRKIHAW